MKHIIFSILALVAFSVNLHSQSSIDSILIAIEANNTTLQAFRKQGDAQKLSNKIGLYPENPEVEFNYLWGKPSVIGNRTDISIKQSFDFPSAYSYRKDISVIQNNQVDIEYKKQLRSIKFETRLVWIDLVHYNTMESELLKRIANSRSIADAYKKGFEAGEVNILEHNKAQLNLLVLAKQLESLQINKSELVSKMASLNGGKSISVNDTVFEKPLIDDDYERWFTKEAINNPVLQWLKQEIELSKKQEKLSMAMGLPRISAGYMSEKVTGENFQGITFGITIPLWENKNTLKYAKTRTLAVQNVESDKKQQVYNKLKALHTKVISSIASVNDYKTRLGSFNNTVLLKKALDGGEISLIEYMFELSIYNESINQLLEMEKETQIKIAELKEQWD